MQEIAADAGRLHFHSAAPSTDCRRRLRDRRARFVHEEALKLWPASPFSACSKRAMRQTRPQPGASLRKRIRAGLPARESADRPSRQFAAFALLSNLPVSLQKQNAFSGLELLCLPFSWPEVRLYYSLLPADTAVGRLRSQYAKRQVKTQRRWPVPAAVEKTRLRSNNALLKTAPGALALLGFVLFDLFIFPGGNRRHLVVVRVFSRQTRADGQQNQKQSNRTHQRHCSTPSAGGRPDIILDCHWKLY